MLKIEIPPVQRGLRAALNLSADAAIWFRAAQRISTH